MFCKAGGSAMGLHRAFPAAEIVGVDSEYQPRYPFKFVKADALNLTWNLGIFDLIWTSPPCQRYTQMLNHGLTNRNNHPDYIDIVRNMLLGSGASYIIKNVVGAPLLKSVLLCGQMFDLRVMRHRLFECSFPVNAPAHKSHNKRGGIRKRGDGGYYYRVYGHEVGTRKEWQEAMGISWMTKSELAEAIPPAYSEYIANQYKLTQLNQ